MKNRDADTLAGDIENAKTYVNIKMYPDEGYMEKIGVYQECEQEYGPVPLGQSQAGKTLVSN